MLGSKSVRIHVVIGAALGSAIAAGILACAGSSAPPADPADGSVATVTDVRFESSEDLSTIVVVGPTEAVFTAFEQSEPERVIVDLAKVDAGELEGAIPVFDGIVDEVRVEPISRGGREAMTRVEVVLAARSSYDVRSTEEGIVVEVTPEATAALEEEPAEDEATTDPWALEGAEEESMGAAAWEGLGDELSEVGGESEEPVPAPMPARALSAIDVRRVGDGAIVHLKGDGTVESAVTFTLEDPPRLVLDLPSLESEVRESQLEVGDRQVSRVRVGEHADKVRVVIDAGDAATPFEGRQVIPVPTGLVVALGSGPELEEAIELAAAEAPARRYAESAPDEEPLGAPDEERADEVSPAERLAAEETAWEETGAEQSPSEAPESGAITVFGVELESNAERDRVVVIGEEPVDYLVYEPDPQTVVLSISGAVIVPEAAVRLAPETPGSVSLVTAFEQPEVERPEVRVVVKRAPDLKPQVSRRGSLLIMDFPRGDALASRPPVYTADGDAPEAEPGAAAPGADLFGGSEDRAASSLPAGPGAGSSASAAPAPAPGFPERSAPAAPASGEPPAAIDILNEGGLMDGKEYAGRRISLDFKEVEVADVLRLIAEVSGLNVIAGEEVKGKVTIRLVDVPWDQALDVVLLTKGLGFVRIGNVLRVAAADVLAREEEMRLQERRAKEKLEDLVVKLQPVNYADVKDVSGMVKELLTPRGSVNTDSRTNTIIIKDIASVIDEATALVKAVDTMTPQVMIEAKIVEASLDFSRELGSLWTFGTNPTNEATLGGRDYIFQGGADDGIADGLGNQVVFGNPITAGPTGVLALAATVIDAKFNYEVELQAAEASGDGKVISSPRVVTLDNSTARIEQGVSIPFQTFENGDAQLEFVDAVLSLDVTPHITSDGSIIMEIEVSRNAPDDSVFTLTGSPAIAKNQVTTETLVKDGQTLVLGGIYVVNNSERQSRVPFLSRVPFIGNLFKSTEFSDSRKELLVFVSPRIVQTPGAEDAI